MLSFKRYLYQVSGLPPTPLRLHFSTLLHATFRLAESNPDFASHNFPLLRIGEVFIHREHALLSALESALSTHNDELAKRLTDASEVHDELVATLEKTEEECTQLQKAVDEQEIDAETMRLSVAASAAEKLKLQEEFTAMETNVKMVTVKLNALKQENSQISNKIARSKKSLNRQKRKEQQKLTAISDLECVLLEATMKNNRLSDDLRKANSNFRSLKSSKDKLTAQISVSRTQLQTASTQCFQLEKSLTDLSTRKITTDGNICTICVENPLEILFRPCMHVCACAKCARKLQSCPVCCAVPTRRDKIYL